MSIDRLSRMPERGSADRDAMNALLDSQPWGTLSTVSLHGEPWVVPIFYARDGDRLLFHGSTGAGALRAVAAGAPVAFCVAAMDALVVGATTFDSSANYRSAVLRGTASVLTGDEKADALDVLSDRLIPGRVAEVRPSSRKELAATVALALPIEEGQWLYKARSGQASEPEEPTDAWGGIVPLHTRWGTPEAAPWSRADLPESVRRLGGSSL